MPGSESTLFNPQMVGGGVFFGFFGDIPAPLSQQGCDPFAQTQRSKLQHRRARINQQINKEMRMRAGAENLFK